MGPLDHRTDEMDVGRRTWHWPAGSGMQMPPAGGGVRFRVAARIPHSIRLQTRPRLTPERSSTGVVMSQRRGDPSPRVAGIDTAAAISFPASPLVPGCES